MASRLSLELRGNKGASVTLDYNEGMIASRFLEELPADCLRVSDQADPYDAAGVSHDMPARRGGASGGARVSRFDGIREGVHVIHPQFGVGRVLSVMRGGNARAKVQFRDVGMKTLVLEYARLEVVD